MKVEYTIKPTSGWQYLDWREIWDYRDLLFLLVRRDFISRYRQTILGPLWFIIQPLIMTVVFTIIFNRFARLPTDELPPMLFYLCGLLPWSYFSQTLGSNFNIFMANRDLFGKVYFPRLVVPLANCLSGLFAFAIQAATFFAFWLYFKFFTAAGTTFGARAGVVWLPLLLAQAALLSMGVGFWMSALTAKYRDLIHLNSFIIQLWLYGTPIIYPLSRVPDEWRWLVVLNPMSTIVENFKYVLLGQGVVLPVYNLVSLALTLLIFVSGLFLFQKVERTFIDTA